MKKQDHLYRNIYPRYASNKEEHHLLMALRARVFSRLRTIKNRDWELRMKAFILPVVYFGIYLTALFSPNYGIFLFSYSLLGLMVVLIFLNLIHEIAHENVFETKFLKENYLYFFDIIGANSFMWKKRHVIFHHNFPNVTGWDSDIEKSKFLKVHPNEKGKWLTKYQNAIVILYPFFLFNWFLVRDFRDFFNKNVIVRRVGEIPFIEYVKLFLFKMIFVGYIFILPIYLTPFSTFQVFLSVLLMFFVAGVYALFVLLPPHVNINNQFPEVIENKIINSSWLMHQILTTNDITQENWFTRYIMANFNYHIAHHLFPKVSYLYAKEVTEVVRDFCSEKGLPYKSFSIWKTLKDHYHLINNNRSKINIWEEDM